MLTNRLLAFTVVCNLSVDSWSITVIYFKFVRIRGLRARPRAGVCAGGKCDAEAGRDPQRIRHIFPHLCERRWWLWVEEDGDVWSSESFSAILTIKECIAFKILLFIRFRNEWMNGTGSEPLPAVIWSAVWLSSWALTALIGANYDAASCFCEGGMDCFVCLSCNHIPWLFMRSQILNLLLSLF